MSATDASSTGSTFDPKKAEAFAGRMLGALNDGAFCLMASIGHRTGLFDAMRDQAPLTSSEIASLAGRNERYVREWLGAMVTAGVVNVDPQSVRYQLPAEHAAFLTRVAGADNLAIFAQYVPLLGNVEDDIVECFKKGGGVFRSLLARIPHPSAHPRSGRAARARSARTRCRMRQRPHPEPAGRTLPEEPLRRDGSFEGGHSDRKSVV